MWYRLVTALAVTGLISSTLPQIKAQTYNIWPLGDSITEGEGSANYNGYRKPLYDKLKAYVAQQNEGVDINFVGTQSDGNFPDPENDGWAGKQSSFIRANAQSWLNSLSAQGDTPDFVLFHIGTNDVSANRGRQFIIDDIDATLDIIWSNGANIKIFLCGIIPRLDGKNPQTSSLNSDIWGLVDRRRNQEGKPIYYVDQYNEFMNHTNWETDYMTNTTDKLHPNETGYNAMANRFKGVVAQYLVPGTTPFELITFAGFASENTINLKWATATETNNLGFYIEHSFGDTPFSEAGFVDGNGTTVEEQHYAFTYEAKLSGLHRFRLRQVDTDGTTAYSAEIAVVVQPANRIAMQQNYPNPFKPGFSLSADTKIPFVLQNSSRVNVNIYNITGQLIKALADRQFEAGLNELRWDGHDDRGMLVASGTYLIRLQSDSQVLSKTMQLVR